MSQGQADLTQGSATATETTKEPPGETPTAAALFGQPGDYDVAGHQAGVVDDAQAEGTGCERHAGSASPEDIGRRSRVRLLVAVTSSRSSLGEPVEALDF